MLSPGSPTRSSASRSTRRAEQGFATVSYVAVAAISLWFFAALVNLVVIQYAAGVVRAAVDEGARRGADAHSELSACLERAEEVLAGLLGGPYGAEISVTCNRDGAWMRATAGGVVRGLVPPIPDMQISAEAMAVIEGT